MKQGHLAYRYVQMARGTGELTAVPRRGDDGAGLRMHAARLATLQDLAAEQEPIVTFFFARGLAP
jgi:hypothetical protein